VERREDEDYYRENDTDLFLVYSLNDLKMVYQKEVDLGYRYKYGYNHDLRKYVGRAMNILMNSQNEVFASYGDGRIEQLDVLF
jgi:hypothetical protein